MKAPSDRFSLFQKLLHNCSHNTKDIQAVGVKTVFRDDTSNNRYFIFAREDPVRSAEFSKLVGFEIIIILIIGNFPTIGPYFCKKMPLKFPGAFVMILTTLRVSKNVSPPSGESDQSFLPNSG